MFRETLLHRAKRQNDWFIRLDYETKQKFADANVEVLKLLRVCEASIVSLEMPLCKINSNVDN